MSKNKGGDNRNGFLGEAYVSGLEWKEPGSSLYLNSLHPIYVNSLPPIDANFFAIPGISNKTNYYPNLDTDSDWKESCKNFLQDSGAYNFFKEIEFFSSVMEDELAKSESLLLQREPYNKEHFLKKILASIELFVWCSQMVKQNSQKIIFSFKEKKEINHEDVSPILCVILGPFDDLLGQVGVCVANLEILYKKLSSER